MKRPPRRAAPPRVRQTPAPRRVPKDGEVAAAFARIPVVRDVTWEQVRAESREE